MTLPPNAGSQPLDAERGGASFTLTNRLLRAIWIVAWTLTARWTPPPLHAWRAMVLRAFGAEIGRGVRVYSSVTIWFPANLVMADFACLGPRVNCYNQGTIRIGRRATVSQGAHLCASTHDPSDRSFRLLLRPITIEAEAWVAADAFVGPGVTVGEGAVLGARAAAFRDLDPWTVYRGNPAVRLRDRAFAEAIAPQR